MLLFYVLSINIRKITVKYYTNWYSISIYIRLKKDIFHLTIIGIFVLKFMDYILYWIILPNIIENSI